jgi:hypothetical protein
LEFIKTPEKERKKNARELRKERIKRVTFNLNLERIVYEPDDFEFEFDSFHEKNDSCDDMNQMSDELNVDFNDLSIWENKDPDDGDFIDMSLSSEDSSFENSLRFECSNSSNSNNGISKLDQSSFSFNASDEEGELLNVFGGIDDGWEHFGSNPDKSEHLEWPEMIFSSEKMEHEKEHDATASTVDMENSSNEHEQIATDISLHDCGRDDSHDESRSDSEDENDEFGNVEGVFTGTDESFVEKISRENFSRSIDEFQDTDDDSAQDSWAQCYEQHAPFLDKKLPCKHADHEIFQYSVRTKDEDKLDSSIDGHDSTNLDERELSMSSIDGPRRLSSVDTVPRAQDILRPLSNDESLEYSQSSLNFSYPSSKNSSKLYLSSCTDEWDQSDFESFTDGQPFIIHDVLDNSQIIAESPSFNDGSDSGNEDNEYDEFVRNVAEEFCCEKGDSHSSGGEKTITTTSTADTSCETVEGYSCLSRGSGSSNEGEEERVLGILRRDSYIPTIDSPRHVRKPIGDNLDYLESKVKDLNFRNTINRIPLIPKHHGSTIVMDRKDEVENHETDETQLHSQNISFDHKLQSTSDHSNNGIRRHPTAARLKTLRQSTAWKRRYGK